MVLSHRGEEAREMAKIADDYPFPTSGFIGFRILPGVRLVAENQR